MEELKSLVKLGISFSFMQIQTNLKGSLQLSLTLNCDNLIFKNESKKFVIQNGRSLLFQLIQVQTAIDPSSQEYLEKEIYIDVYTHSWNGSNLFGRLAVKPFKDKKYEKHWNLSLTNQKEFIKVIFKTKIASEKALWTNQQSKIKETKSPTSKGSKKSEIEKKSSQDPFQLLQLQKQNQRLKKQLQRLQKNNLQQQNNLSKSNQDNLFAFQKLKSRNQQLQQKLVQELTNILFKQALIQQLTKQKEELRSKLHQQKDFDAQTKQLTQKLQEVSKSNLYLLGEIEHLQLKKQNLEDQKAILANNFDESTKIIEEKRQLVMVLSTEIAELKSKLQQKDKQKQDLLSFQSQVAQKQKYLAQENEKLNQKCQTQQSRISEQELMISELKINSEEREKQLNSQIQRLLQSITEIRKEDEERNKILQTYQDEINITKRALDSATHLLEQKSNSLKMLLQSILGYLTQFNQRQQILEQEQLRELSKYVAILNIQELGIQHKLAQISKNHREKVLQLNNNNEILILQLKKVKQFFTEVTQQANILKERIEEEKQEKQRMMNQLKQTKILLMEFSETQSILAEQVKKQQSLTKQLQQQNQALKQQETQLGKRLTQLQHVYSQAVRTFEEEKKVLVNLGDQSVIQVKRICLELQKKILKSETKISEMQINLQIQAQKCQYLRQKVTYMQLVNSGLNKEINQLKQQVFIQKNKSIESFKRSEQQIIQLNKLTESNEMLIKLVRTLQQQLQRKDDEDKKKNFDILYESKSQNYIKVTQSKISKIEERDVKSQINPQSQQENSQESKKIWHLKLEIQSILFEKSKQELQKICIQQKLKRYIISQNEQFNELIRLKTEVKQLKFELQKNETKIAFISQAKASFEKELAKMKDLEKEMFRMQKQLIAQREKKLQMEQKFNTKLQHYLYQKRKLMAQINELKSEIYQKEKYQSNQNQNIEKIHFRQLKEIKAQFLQQKQNFASIMQSMQKQNEQKLDEIRRQIEKMFQTYSFSQQTKVELKEQVRQCHEIIQKLVKQKQSLESNSEYCTKKYEKLKNYCSQIEQQLKSLSNQFDQSLKTKGSKNTKNIEINVEILRQKLKQWINRKRFDLRQQQSNKLVLSFFEQFYQKVRQFLQEMITDLT